MPVRFKETAMSFEVALVGGDAVGAIEYGEKVWQQVDQHSTGSDLRETSAEPISDGGAELRAHWTRNDSGDW